MCIQIREIRMAYDIFPIEELLLDAMGVRFTSRSEWISTKGGSLQSHSKMEKENKD